MDPEATERIRPLLEDHEELLWTGRPVQGFVIPKGGRKFVFSMSLGGLIAFGAVWMMWNHPDTGTFLRVFSLVPASIGCYFLFGRFLFNIWTRANTWYALTDHRAIEVTNFIARKVDSEELYHQDQLEYIDGRDDRGTVQFGGGTSLSTSYDESLDPDRAGRAWDAGVPQARWAMETQFRHIDEAFEVYKLARDQVAE
jgi:hypothetical protein